MDNKTGGGLNWIIIRTVLQKECYVARALAREGFETFCPLEIRSQAVSRHTKRRKVFEVVLIPKVVFAQIPAFEDNLMNRFNYVTGLHRNIQGGVSTIPHAQMLQFQGSHQAWLAASLKAHSGGTPGKVKKPKWRSIDALKEFFDAETGEILEERAA